jgi:hypothetical protein
MTKTKSITIQFRTHKNGSLMVAYSDDLRGLLVHGRSAAEIEAKLPDAVKEILTAQGMEVIYVDLEPKADEEKLVDFLPAGLIAKAGITQHQ